MNTLETGIAATTEPDIAELIARARVAHEAAHPSSLNALHHAFEAGEVLTILKDLCRRGEWGRALKQTGIPPSTARLYMQLYRERDRILAAGCTSIRQARDFLSGAAAKRAEKRRQQAEARETEEATAYDRGYEAGFRDGKAVAEAEFEATAEAAYQQGLADGQKASSNGHRPSKADLRWMLKQLHPDKFEANGSKAAKDHAKRVTQWLNDLMASANS
jgi:hypothetical protein